MTITGWPLTLDQFLALPEAKPALEFGPHGEVTQKMSPTSEHSLIQSRFDRRLNDHAEPRGLGVAYPELRVILGGESRVPDLAFYRAGREPGPGYATTPPDLVIEIASPGQSRTELADKCAWYIHQGVSLALLVDPVDRSVRAFPSASTLRATDVLPFGDLLPGLQMSVAEVFAAPA